MNTLSQIFQGIRRAFQWWIVVQPWEQALRVRMGKHVQRIGPGVHLRIPLVHSVYRQSVRMRVTTLPLQTLTTTDGKTLTLAATVGYVIDDIERLYQTLHHAEGTIINMAQSTIAEYVSTSTLKDVQPAAVESHVSGKLAFDRYGLGEARIRIVDFAVVRTFRLMNSEDYRDSGGGERLNTNVSTDKEGAL